MTNHTASPAQVNLITSLLSERLAPQALTNQIASLGGVSALDKRTASNTITALFSAPKAPKAPKAAGQQTPLQAALASVPKSRYAVPTIQADLVLTNQTNSNDLYFFEVREYKETLYMRRLHGAPGDFLRTRLSAADQIAILKLIATDAVGYARTFGENFSVCGACMAPLTDDTSRALSFGPECRKRFGL